MELNDLSKERLKILRGVIAKHTSSSDEYLCVVGHLAFLYASGAFEDRSNIELARQSVKSSEFLSVITGVDMGITANSMIRIFMEMIDK